MSAQPSTATQLALLELAMRPTAAAPPSRTSGLAPQFAAMLPSASPNQVVAPARERPGLILVSDPAPVPATA